MSAKLNIFAALPQQFSDSEDEVDTKKQGKQVKTTDGKKQDKGTTQKGDHIKGGKDHHHKKVKGAPAEGTHTSERQSGTGQPAFDKKSAKKGGAGKGNWGSNRDDRREDRTGEAETENQDNEPEKPEGITLEEYYSKTKVTKNEPQVNEAKAKVTSEQLMKEVLQGKATLLAPRNKADANEKPQPKKKLADEEEHVVIGQTQYADLLNFRTGFIEREFGRKRGDAEAPRKREERPVEKREEAVETTENAEQPTETHAEGEEKRERNNNRRGNGRGGRGNKRGGSFRGNTNTNRGGNYRKNFQNQPKVNIEDDSAFPKLG